MTFRIKALIAAIAWLVVPALTLPWVSHTRSTLIEAQRAALADRTALIAERLSNHGLTADVLARAGSAGADALYATHLANWIDIDGNREDFGDDIAPRAFGIDETIEVRSPYDPASLEFDLVIGTEGRNLFVHVNVTDDRVVYRDTGSLSVHRNDHVQLAMTGADGNYRRFTIAPSQPGPANAFLVTSQQEGSRAIRPDDRIEAYWRADDAGYDVEIRIPLELLSTDFSLSVTDVDNDETRAQQYTLGSASTAYPEDIGTLVLPAPEMEQLLVPWSDTTRLSLIDTSGRLLGQAGELDGAEGIWHVAGESAIGWFDTPTILTSRTPVLVDGMVRGELIGEESTAGALRVLSRFADRLFLFNLLWLVAGAGLAALMAWRVGWRINDLEQRIKGTVDAQGRVRRSLPVRHSSDELGQLELEWQRMTERLHQYNRYLEEMSRRLAHELRTPVTVVSSSLDNLAMDPDGDRDRYLGRAREGVTRLGHILSSMTEATRLEESLNAEEVEYFDLADVISGCVEGYRIAFPDHTFELSIEDRFEKIAGMPELINQMLDKLVANAVEFAVAGTPIRIRLTREEEDAVLRVMNEGPPLTPDLDRPDTLFDAMISVRDEKTAGNHLGLGLYIARIVAEFHGGRIALDNREECQGVMVTVRLPLFRIVGNERSRPE